MHTYIHMALYKGLLQFAETRNLHCCHVGGAMTFLRCLVKMASFLLSVVCGCVCKSKILYFSFWTQCESNTSTCKICVHVMLMWNTCGQIVVFMPFWQRLRSHSADATSVSLPVPLYELTSTRGYQPVGRQQRAVSLNLWCSSREEKCWSFFFWRMDWSPFQYKRVPAHPRHPVHVFLGLSNSG
jgi:hypothetical protein